MKKGLRSLLMVASMCFCLVAGGTTAYAQTVNEADSNDTIETAQLIQANSETAAQAVSGSRPNQYVVNGYTSTTDSDWYKVYLTSGTQYVTCNDNSFVFEVFDSSENRITRGTYVKTGFGVTAYPFNVSTAGYYYVKITGNTSSSQSYILSVGGPTYSVASCEVEFDTVTMADDEDEVLNFNLEDEDALPDDSVVYTISMSGVRTTSVDSIAVINNNSDNTVNLTRYSWNKSGLVSLNMPLKADWDIELSYNKDTSFTPSIKLYYAYPVVSEEIEDDIVITR